ncbi:MAG: hypothetical protein QNK30_15750 [Bacteroidales bacterium]|nr:hypothetical protein [Bacteroidales bacterium]
MKALITKKNIYGIMGTVIVHLIIAIIFMLIKLSSDYKNLDQGILIDISALQEDALEQIIDIDLPLEEGEYIDNIYHDIAVNEASIPEEQFDIDEYIDQIKNEMISAGELSKENFIDQAKQETESDASLEYQEENQIEEEKTAADMASDYQGPTRISYYLENRSKIRLPLPIYKCPDGGTITLEILVNQYGNVISADLLEEKSAGVDYCLLEAAKKAAMTSRFNSGTNFPARQKGTITYIFTSQ